MIHTSREGAVAIVTIDNPPVNATSQAVRQGLLDALSAAAADDGVAAVVIIGAGGRFSAGGDVRELGNPAINRPSLLDTIAVIEASAKPVVAALAGVALGGGLELALACDSRIGAAPLRLGLPEVTLGVIPGAGGTQRLPRLVGAEAALDLATSGRHCSAEEALRMGLLDALCESVESLRAQAVLSARALCREHAAARPAAVCADTDLFRRYRAEHADAWQGQLAPWLIVEAIEQACTRPAAEARAFERQAYLACQNSPQRAALGYLFMARRSAAKAGLAQREAAIAQRLREATANLAQAPDALAGAICAAGDALLDERLAWDATEVDLVAVDRLGFPAHLGGPMFQRSCCIRSSSP